MSADWTLFRNANDVGSPELDPLFSCISNISESDSADTEASGEQSTDPSYGIPQTFSFESLVTYDPEDESVFSF